MTLPHPSDTLGMLWHLGAPGGCVIQHDIWRQEGWQGLSTGIRKGELLTLEFRCIHFSFEFTPKLHGIVVLKKAASPPSHQGGRAPRPAGPTQTSSFRVCWTSRPQTRQPVFLHLGLLNSLQPRTSPGRLCSRLLFPLCGAFTSSAVGLLISLRSSLSSPPNTCILQAALECWPRGNNGRLWRRLRPGPSQYLLQCEATVLKSLPSRTQQRGVPRGFEILF